MPNDQLPPAVEPKNWKEMFEALYPVNDELTEFDPGGWKWWEKVQPEIKRFIEAVEKDALETGKAQAITTQQRELLEWVLNEVIGADEIPPTFETGQHTWISGKTIELKNALKEEARAKVLAKLAQLSALGERENAK